MPKIATRTDFKVSQRTSNRTKTKVGSATSKYSRITDKGLGAGDAQLFGDWNKFRSFLGIDPKTNKGTYIQPSTGRWIDYNYIRFEDKFEIAMQRASIRCAGLLVKKIKEGITTSAPGGKRFQNLSEATRALRRKQAAKKGFKAKTWVGAKGTGYIKSSKPLLRTGDLYRSISSEILGKGEFFVGIPTGAKNREGESLTMIGTVMENGMILKVSHKVANWFGASGVPLKDSTTHILIPPRPFISPVFNKYRSEIFKIYREEFRFVLFEELFHYSKNKINYYKSKLRTHGAGKVKRTVKVQGSRGRPKLSEKVVKKRESEKLKGQLKRQKEREKKVANIAKLKIKSAEKRDKIKEFKKLQTEELRLKRVEDKARIREETRKNKLKEQFVEYAQGRIKKEVVDYVKDKVKKTKK